LRSSSLNSLLASDRRSAGWAAGWASATTGGQIPWSLVPGPAPSPSRARVVRVR
jgi:hypothetical protein